MFYHCSMTGDNYLIEKLRQLLNISTRIFMADRERDWNDNICNCCYPENVPECSQRWQNCPDSLLLYLNRWKSAGFRISVYFWCLLCKTNTDIAPFLHAVALTYALSTNAFFISLVIHLSSCFVCCVWWNEGQTKGSSFLCVVVRIATMQNINNS